MPVAQAHAQLWFATAWEELSGLVQRAEQAGLPTTDHEGWLKQLGTAARGLVISGEAQVKRLPDEAVVERHLIDQLVGWAHELFLACR